MRCWCRLLQPAREARQPLVACDDERLARIAHEWKRKKKKNKDEKEKPEDRGIF